MTEQSVHGPFGAELREIAAKLAAPVSLSLLPTPAPRARAPADPSRRFLTGSGHPGCRRVDSYRREEGELPRLSNSCPLRGQRMTPSLTPGLFVAAVEHQCGEQRTE